MPATGESGECMCPRVRHAFLRSVQLRVTFDSPLPSECAPHHITLHDVRLTFTVRMCTAPHHTASRSTHLYRQNVHRTTSHCIGIAHCIARTAHRTCCRLCVCPHRPFAVAPFNAGFDLYCWDGGSKSYRWVALWTPAWHTAGVSSLTGAAPLPELARDDNPREFILYLPLYNGVQYVSIGVEGGASLLPSPAQTTPRPSPVVFYGTSITQGACCSHLHA